MATNNDDDLYGDLDTYQPTKKAKGANPANKKNPDTQRLQAEVESLRKENEVLKRNMGILFRTAQAEIRRKDRQIAELEKDRNAAKSD